MPHCGILHIQRRNIMKKSYETELPEGYSEAYTVDAKKGKTVLLMNLAKNYFENYDFLHSIILIVAMLLYIVLHELTHGAAYKLTTGRKLTFGFTLSVAYCGVPDIYVYRKAAMTALLAPFVVFTPVFLIPSFLFANAWDKFYCAVLLAMHIGGCAGDLYDTILYIFKFRSPDTLMRDTGPKQTFYTK